MPETVTKATFNPDHYKVSTLDQALLVTVGAVERSEDADAAARERWRWDTPYTLHEIACQLPIAADSCVLDYGCGSGRIAKGLIERTGCTVVGVDVMVSMRRVARAYVASNRFLAVGHHTTPDLECDFAVCLWVLQHSKEPGVDVVRIRDALKPGGRLLVFNESVRMVPTVEHGFVHDGLDVPACLAAVFGEPVARGHLDPKRVPKHFSERSFWAVYRKAS